MTAKKTLPLAEPAITAYSSHATALAIAATNEAYLPWYYCNYIQLYGLKDYNETVDLPLDFYMGPRKDFNYYTNTNWLTFLSTERQLIADTCGDIIDYIVACINSDLYVALHMDEYFMEDRWAYNSRKWDHENLIFGYDLERKVFHIIGFKGANRKFEPSEISFEVFRQAYDSIDIQTDPWRNQLFLIRRVEKEIDPFKGNFRFNLALITDSIREYLLGEDATRKFAMFQNSLSHLVFGMQVYESLKTNLPQFWFDFRPLHVLVEHKTVMAHRISYLRELGYLSEEVAAPLEQAFREMAHACTLMRSTQLRYMASRDRAKDRPLVDKILGELDKLAAREKEALEALLEALEQAQSARQPALA
ncbi:hypothetical protein B5M42_013180 [Paenibacillus athensensis]|uniref:Butirosin biosynthesis protein H N-terminal domain-containing protein n=1 Tax=Paenibacillus athensensis TaxID=1967502 RepID=A0A4Y8Q6B3_9BACL|nr:hypothetical protein [Paenibacillus athensensis]MCD1259788.1 hypothetical protein [Paenibacillus athensensis]